ncbi:MAG: uracil-DNA glycosylase [Crenarchaeota archaeon]|nr:uracil-DNA glycosylase [Thermoproteota archaeon]
MSQIEYEQLVREILSCTKCPLHRYRRRPVPGEGKLDAEIMIVGEAPGEKEDEQGRPFVGPAGQLLTRILNSLGVSREQVYITNIVKCRPPENRDPTPEEIRSCLPYLIRQIQIIKPKVIICLGRHSAREILKLCGLRESEVSQISKIRGKVFNVKFMGQQDIIVVPTYHPAAALYNPRLRSYITEDIKKAVEIAQGRYRVERGSILDFLS